MTTARHAAGGAPRRLLLVGLAVAVAIVLALVATAVRRPAATRDRGYDVVVYGATPSGVIAAIAARRQGRTVALVEPSGQVGGMVTGGLSHTDVGNKAVIGGITKEYFRRIAQVYGAGEGYDFEPKVGARVMDQMLRDAGVPVFTRQQLVEGSSGVTRHGTTVVSFRTTSGRTFAGKVFIDASYEGDLMAGAGVSFTSGRESSAQYGESAAGVQAYNGDFAPPVSAHEPDGTLSAQVSPAPLAAPGSADDHVQAYTFRVTSTDVPANRVAYPKPSGYDPRNYALLARWLPGYQARLGRNLAATDVLALTPLPHGKFDTNSVGPFSTDFLNGSFGYPDAGVATRQEIYQQTKDYEEGLLYFLQNDPAVPPSLHADMAKYGLAADEFTANGNWPPQLYVREARRMLGAYVLTQQDLQTATTKSDVVALGSYRMDEHASARGVAPDGTAENEGTFKVTTAGSYQLPYRIITPKRSEATNLLVTDALSTTHVAWSGVRMEPQFMMLGQAAADAASLALASRQAVQDVSVPQLQALLVNGGMILSLHPS